MSVTSPNFAAMVGGRSPRATTLGPADHTKDTIAPSSMAGDGAGGVAHTSNNFNANNRGSVTSGSTIGGGGPIMNPTGGPASYSPEERAFHQTFPFVPLSEKVVEHYQCSVSRSKVLRIGKLYLTALRMCFVSSFLKEPIHLPWDSVASIEKKSNFLFEMIVVKRTPSAIQLQTEMELDEKEAKKEKKMSGMGSDAASTAPRMRANSAFPRDSNGPPDVAEISTGGVGEDESFTGFLTGSSDGAYRMMLMLHSVRARYKRTAAEGGLLVSNPTSPLPSPQNNMGGGSSNGSMTPRGATDALAGSGGGAAVVSNYSMMSEDPVRAANMQDGDAADLPLGSNGSMTLNPSTSEQQQALLVAISSATGTPSKQQNNTNTTDSFTTQGSQQQQQLPPQLNISSPAIAPLPTPTTNTTPAASLISATESPPDLIATATQNKELATAARASVVLGANDHIVLQSNLQRAMLTEEQRKKLEKGHTHLRTSSAIIGSATVNGGIVGIGAEGEDFSQHESILKFFPYVPRNEIIVDQFQCSYAIGVHRIGRLYITGNYLLFSSHFMSEPIIIRLVDIEKIEKFQTIMVLDGFNVHLRPEATRLTVGQIAQAGGIVPACAIRAGMMTTNPAEGMTGVPVEGSSGDATAEGAANANANNNSSGGVNEGPTAPSAAAVSSPTANIASPDNNNNNTAVTSTSGTTTPTAAVASGQTSPALGASTNVSFGSGASFNNGATTPTLSAGGNGPMPFLAAGLPSSSVHVASTAPAYSKSTYTFTSFVGSRDQAFGIIQHFCQSHTDRVNAIAHRCPKPREDILAAEEAARQKDAKEREAREKKEKKDKKADSKTKDKDGSAAVADGNSASPAVTPGLDASLAPVSSPPPVSLASPNVASPTNTNSTAAVEDTINANGRSWRAFRTSTSKPHVYNTFIPVSGQEDLAKITTDFAGGLSDVPHFFGKEGAKELITPFKFPQGIDLLDVFYHCFDDDHEILGRYHEDRRDTGQTWEPWRAHLSAATFSGKANNGSGANNGLGGGQREMKSKTVIRVVGEKICDYNEFQRYAFFNVAGSNNKRMLLVQVSGQAQGAMFSDSFRAETLMIFEEEYVGGGGGGEAPSADHADADVYFNPNKGNTVVTMKAYGYINFLRSVWVKGKILSAALTEMPECYKTLSGMMLKRLTEVSAAQRAAVANSALAGAAAIAAAPTSASSLLPPPPSADTPAPPPPIAAVAHSTGGGAEASSSPVVVAGGGGGGGSIRESLKPSDLLGFLADAETKKIPIAALGPAAALVIILFLYSLWCLSSVLLFGYGELPSVTAAKSALAASAAAAATVTASGVSTGIDATNAAIPFGGDQSAVALATAAAISDVYNVALRPLLVIIYGISTLVLGALGTEYALAAKDGLGL